MKTSLVAVSMFALIGSAVEVGATQPPIIASGSAGAQATAQATAQAAQTQQAAQQVRQSVTSAPSQNVAVTTAGGGSGGGTTTIRNTPDPYAPTINATVTCFKPISAGAVGAGVGFSIGGGEIDFGCDLREDSRQLYGLGEREAAVSLMCNKPLVAKVLGPKRCPDQHKVASSGRQCWQDEIIAKRMNAPVCQ